MMKPSHALVLIALLAPATRAQTSADPQAAIENWRNAHGPSWTSELDPRTGFVRSLYGGHTESTGHLSDDRGAFALTQPTGSNARMSLNTWRNIAGVSTPVLVL